MNLVRTFPKILLALGLLTALTVRADVASDLSGKWKAEFDTPSGPQAFTFDLKGTIDVLTGTCTSNFGTQEIQDGVIRGTTISFSVMVKVADEPLELKFTGQWKGETIDLTRQVGNFEPQQVVAHRVPAVADDAPPPAAKK